MRRTAEHREVAHVTIKIRSRDGTFSDIFDDTSKMIPGITFIMIIFSLTRRTAEDLDYHKNLKFSKPKVVSSDGLELAPLLAS